MQDLSSFFLDGSVLPEQQEFEVCEVLSEWALKAQQQAGLAITNAIMTAMNFLRITFLRYERLRNIPENSGFVPLAELAELVVALVEELLGGEGAEVVEVF